MVLAIVRELGVVRPTCLAWPFLFQAQAELDRGNITAAGVKLRESVRRYLHALCKLHDCMPKKQRTPREMLKALHKRKLVGCRQWISDMITLGNAAAHCKPVKASTLRTALSIFAMILNETSELDLPTRGGAV